MTAGQVTYAWEPGQHQIAYETGDWQTGCHYTKCANGYGASVNNTSCRQGHKFTGKFASGYPACPHGYAITIGESRIAHCANDPECMTIGYRAPCGRTTTRKTDDIYGYVTRTSTGCHSTTINE